MMKKTLSFLLLFLAVVVFATWQYIKKIELLTTSTENLN